MPDKQRKAAAFTLHASLLCAPDVAGEGGAGGWGAGMVKAGVLEVLELGLGEGGGGGEEVERLCDGAICQPAQAERVSGWTSQHLGPRSTTSLPAKPFAAPSLAN